MVGDQQLDLARCGIGDHLWSGINGEHDATYALLGVTGDQPDPVPALSCAGVGPVVQKGQDL